MQTNTEKVTYESHITVDGSRDGMLKFEYEMKKLGIKVIHVGNGFPDD